MDSCVHDTVMACAFILWRLVVYGMSVSVGLGPLELYELVILVLVVVGLIPMTVRFPQCRVKWFYMAYLAFAVGRVASIVEYEALAVLEEHVGIAVAGFLCWWTAMTGAADAKEQGMKR